ncbi:bifunctional GNAT family N-acetyltransferase/carbon-nitrogen hydrolase family protein [Legionella cardiaca]|uniref:Bifunctional GNAT family N-acetyltransferase/carbon-nitrogen hydrolase family protein n=1 Tax=Legionella cardiaca TaxID=1071983 RepID=A0ABY8AV81_9GAMM|nr:bifunctional GNAT family N-acetyltransferase/carbon-nitrogen hydrolase family protein [Legionella cardiaca]WED43651.1 bifunctional GNAT family N-acetyltransferase/carbon-nitrogen hydrolase family protein [Legionella cardiaca]
MTDHTTKKPIVVVRNAKINDIPRIRSLVARAYPAHMETYTPDALRGHIHHFPKGQFVVEYDDQIVGYCATFKISGDIALQPHTWNEITGGGYASRHDPNGDFLYGMEVCVHPEYRGLRIGNRLYTARKKLCQAEGLKGIVFGGRIPRYHKKFKLFPNVNDYVNAVITKEVKDPVLSFQLRNDFQLIGVLANYLPIDKQSMGYAAHLVWYTPIAMITEQAGKTAIPEQIVDKVRLSVVQYMQRRVHSFEEFSQHVEYFIDVVADYYADFVLFPELFTLQLLSIENSDLSPSQAILQLTEYTEPFLKLMSTLAVKYNINIIGGSHPTKANGNIYNVAYVFLRDGQIHEQYKIHPTPNERYWWDIHGGDELKTIMTDCGPIAVLICYDCEFPELARHVINQGAKILFVPFCTDERQSYMRVRYCCQARAIENQCYVVIAGNVGNLPGVANMAIQYAQSSIFTPCDFPFARDGIAADTTPNVEMVCFADLSMHNLEIVRNQGTVLNLKDRRHDLYSVRWKHK